MLLSLHKTNASACALASFSEPKLDRLQVCGSGFTAAPIGLHIERNLLALVETMQAGLLDRRDVNEYIGAAVILNDKAVAPLGIEKFNGTCGHEWPPYKNAQRRRGPYKTISHGFDIRILRVLGEGRSAETTRSGAIANAGI
jgi:hypothetical protein